MQWFRFLSFDLFKPMFKAWLAFEELKATVELSPEDAAQEAQRRRREQWVAATCSDLPPEVAHVGETVLGAVVGDADVESGASKAGQKPPPDGQEEFGGVQALPSFHIPRRRMQICIGNA
jgi:hypothetical protein